MEREQRCGRQKARTKNTGRGGKGRREEDVGLEKREINGVKKRLVNRYGAMMLSPPHDDFYYRLTLDRLSPSRPGVFDGSRSTCDVETSLSPH